MSKKRNRPNGPVEVELKVHIISEDGDTRGVATIGMGFGGYPAPSEIAERVKDFAEDDMKRLAPGYRLQTSAELWDSACMEKTGERFATPAEWREYAPVQ